MPARGWSRHRRFWILGCIAALAIAAGWATAEAVRRAPPDAQPPDGARVFNLPDGKAQISINIRHDHSIEVQWRDRDATTWRAPDVVFVDVDLVVTDLRIRVGGPTLALRASLSPPDTLVDDDSALPQEVTNDDMTLFVVCREDSCSRSETYDGLLAEAPQVAPDGEHAFLGAIDGTFVAWADGDFTQAASSGLPSLGDRQAQPLMAPDGSLRLVNGTPGPGGCDYTLFTSDPGSAAFVPRARYRDSLDRRRHCETSLQTFSSDYVVVNRDPGRAWFLTHEGDRWRRVIDDPSGQVRYPRSGRSRLAGTYQISGFWHWRQVVATSPDGRSLVVQVHFPGSETWSEPQTVAEAPPGAVCISIVPKPTYTWDEEDPFYVHLTCRTRSSRDAPWVYSYPTAVSEDGITWRSLLATASAIRVGQDLFFAGRPSHLWTPSDGLSELALPVPEGDTVTPLEGGSFALGHLETTEPGRCRLVVRLADAGDTAWSDPVPSTATPIPLGQCSLDSTSGENRNVYYYLGHRSPHEERMVRLVWRDGAPLVEDGPDAEG